MVSLHTETARFKWVGHKNELCLFWNTLLYLFVPTSETHWGISNSIDASFGLIQSASAGTVSPSSPSNSVNKRKGWSSWQYKDDSGWQDGDIRVVSVPHA